MPVIATAGWSIPKSVAGRFPEEGTGLARYAQVFKGVEVNSTFYRRHRISTFERWAASVPDDFRFAVKLPGEMTHGLRLRNIGPVFETLLADVAPLGKKLGPLLCQLPPSLSFRTEEAESAFATMRGMYDGTIVVEPRHRSWGAPSAIETLQRQGMGRVFADPAPVWRKDDFPMSPSYVRLHGSPQIYYSSYDEAEIRAFLEWLEPESWCVFDNTAAGAACENALVMLDAASGVSKGPAERKIP